MNSEMKQNELALDALEQVSGGTGTGGISSASQHVAALSAHLQEGTHQPGAKYQS